uniref:Pre-mRNA-splicing factor Syf1-like N-terminal HAT-repeats domain-containing protein n=1 Tax=Oryza punctata TaxID=4537 RepID=A0A0E0JKI5_ORYPU
MPHQHLRRSPAPPPWRIHDEEDDAILRWIRGKRDESPRGILGHTPHCADYAFLDLTLVSITQTEVVEQRALCQTVMAAVVAMPVVMALPSEADLPYEEDVLRDPHRLRPWHRYLAARAAEPLQARAVIYECAVCALPGSYKLWHAYLLEHAKPPCGGSTRRTRP